MAAAGVARPDLQSRNSDSGPAARPQQPETAAESGGRRAEPYRRGDQGPAGAAAAAGTEQAPAAGAMQRKGRGGTGAEVPASPGKTQGETPGAGF